VRDLSSDPRQAYTELPEIAATRADELRPMLQPYIDVTDFYGIFITGAVLVLGKNPPQGEQDIAVRDLLADVFDYLYEARDLIVRGKAEIAYPLARRAYESLSLMVACHLDTRLSERWMRGKRVSNEDVRRILAKHPMGEAAEKTRELYKSFSEISHPNRDTVARRFLGEGNQFVLGSIGRPNLVLLADYALKTLNLWFWFGAFIALVYLPLLGKSEPEILKSYYAAADRATEVSQWLVAQYNRVLAEEQAEMRKIGTSV